MDDKKDYSEYTTILDKKQVEMLTPEQKSIKDFTGNKGGLNEDKGKAVKVSVAFFIFICIISGLIGGVLFLGGSLIYDTIKPSEEYCLKTPGEIQTNSTGSSGVTIEVDSVISPATAVAAKVLPSIVGIRVTTQVTSGRYGTYETSGEGSGVIYTTDGYIITNYHVIEMMITSSGENNPNSTMKVYLCQDQEQAYDASVIGYDISSDLAVIKIEETNLSAVELGESKSLAVGDIAIALGNPGGLEFMGSVSQGIISGLNRVITVEETYENITLIQTDAAINPGNSGGALVDIEGKLIGINSVKIVKDGYEGMGFAIPVEDVISICNNIIKNGNSNSAYLGLEFNTSYTPEYLQAYGYPAGLVISSVAQGSPAEEAGIEIEDILTSFGGATVESTAELIKQKAKYNSGDSVEVVVYRLTLTGSGWNRKWTGSYVNLTVILG